MPTIPFKSVTKNNGDKQGFDHNKIARSIWLAVEKVGGTDKKRAELLSEEVLLHLINTFPQKKTLTTVEIGDAVEKILIEHGHAKVSKEFILYRENQRHATKDKESLGIEDDIGLSYNTLYILKRRYLKRNEKGETIETPRHMLERVAKALSDVEKGKKKKKEWYEKFLSTMVSFDFLPGTRTLTNSGKDRSQLANCFVWPLEDDIDDIFKIVYN